MSVSETKSQLRRQMRERRSAVTPAQRDQWSAAVVTRVMALPAIVQARSVFCYVSMGHEVRTDDLIDKLLGLRKVVAVPRPWSPVHSEKDWATAMGVCFIDSRDDLVNCQGRVRGWACEAFDVVIVPGLAFTPACDRLGMGGGYYDRYLAAHRPPLVLGLCFDAQIIPTLPVEPHDQPMDMLITETAVLTRPLPMTT